MKMIIGLITLLAIFCVAYGSDIEKQEEQVIPSYVIENGNEVQQDSLTASEDEEWDETFPVGHLTRFEQVVVIIYFLSPFVIELSLFCYIVYRVIKYIKGERRKRKTDS